MSVSLSEQRNQDSCREDFLWCGIMVADDYALEISVTRPIMRVMDNLIAPVAGEYDKLFDAASVITDIHKGDLNSTVKDIISPVLGTIVGVLVLPFFGPSGALIIGLIAKKIAEESYKDLRTCFRNWHKKCFDRR
jgi:hypothetical protein